MIPPLHDPDLPAFSFSDAVALSGITDKQLRNFLENGRGILSVGAKSEGGRWMFSLSELAQIMIVSDINRRTRIAPQAAAELARAAGPTVLEIIAAIARESDDWMGWDILCRFNPEDGSIDAFARGQGEEPENVEWRALTEKTISAPLDITGAPPIASSSHLFIPLDVLMMDLVRNAIGLKRDGRFPPAWNVQ